MVVDEANAGFVLNFHHLAIRYDLKIVVSVVLDIVYRRLLFIEEVSTVTQLGKFIQTGFTFRKGTDQLIHIRIELLISVYITVDLEHGTGKQMVRIILIDLSRMDCAIDVSVLGLELDYGTIRSNVDRELCLVENEALGRFQLAHDPFPESHILKGEDTVCIGHRRQNSVFLCEFRIILRKEAEQRTHNRLSVFVDLVAFDVTANEFVLDGDENGFAVLGDFYLDRRFIEHIPGRRLQLTDNPLSVPDIFKAELTGAVRLRYTHGSFLSKLRFAFTEQAEYRTGDHIAVLVELGTFNVAADIPVLQLDVHHIAVFRHCDRICLLIENKAFGRLDLTNDPGSEGHLFKFEGTVLCAFRR